MARSTGREFVLYVNFARNLQLETTARSPRAKTKTSTEAYDVFVRIQFGSDTMDTPLQEKTTTVHPVFGFEKVLRWRTETELEFFVMQIMPQNQQERMVGRCKVDMRSVMNSDWEGDMTLFRRDQKIGKLHVGVEWLETAAAPSTTASRGAMGNQMASGVPGPSQAGDPAATGAPDDLAFRLAHMDRESVQRYALRLSEVVMQLHGSRHEDWAQWRTRENSLLEEVVVLQRLATDRQHIGVSELQFHQELTAERRRRIDAELKLTSADRYRQEASAADRAARLHTSQSSMAFEAEAAECRAYIHRAREARKAEERAFTEERHAENRTQALRQEVTRELTHAQRRAAEGELQTQALEAQALSQAWKLSGKLRGEMEMVEELRRNKGRSAQLRQEEHVSARRALGDLQEVQRRVGQLLNELPQ
eukprot:TRINITY_DN15974_c0_g1_i1.p1 TRINITY_DN15974_c0_g1~~TRINITY_DN15974_c0_g1_i1.p1  ORF type:complete len:421 (+),score=75.94 TRINITY_DN15974_c0_g1_i1:176-1438(+)